MRYGIRGGLAALIASLVMAAPALAHHPVGSATQACDESTGEITLVATFDNPGFATTVTATDSGGLDLGPVQSAPATFQAATPGPDRAAGTVSFHWVAEHDQGTVMAPYEAVSGCEAPPPPTTTTTVPPPPPPHHSGGPPTHRIGTSVHGHSRHNSPSPAAKAPPPGVQNGALPFSGDPVLPLILMGLGLIGGGVAIRKAYG